MTETSIPGPLVENVSYETHLARLQQVVERLETGALDLHESLNLFEEGMSLARQCDLELQSAEERVKVLLSEACSRDTLSTRSDLPLEPVAVEDSREYTDD